MENDGRRERSERDLPMADQHPSSRAQLPVHHRRNAFRRDRAEKIPFRQQVRSRNPVIN